MSVALPQAKLKECLVNAAVPKVAEGWRKGQEKEGGDIATLALLFHPMATTVRKGMEAASQGILCLCKSTQTMGRPHQRHFCS